MNAIFQLDDYRTGDALHLYLPIPIFYSPTTQVLPDNPATATKHDILDLLSNFEEDGESDPVSKDTVLRALAFVDELNLGRFDRLPEVAATPSGEVLLEWIKANGKQRFAVCISEDISISYAGISQYGRIKGAEHYENAADVIQSQLSRAFSKYSSAV